MDQLLDEIFAFLAANKGRVLSERFASRVKSQAAPVLMALGVELASRRKSTEELDADLQKLRAKKQTIESERSLAEREFNRAWTVALDQLEQGLPTAKNDVTAEITKKIAATPMLEVSKLVRELPTVLNRVIDDKLSPLTRTFEQGTRDATERLNATYPTLSVGETGAIDVHTKDGSTFISGLAGGGAAAAVGVGAAAAGSAVAAGIAAANAAALAATTTVAVPSMVSGLLTAAGFGCIRAWLPEPPLSRLLPP